MFDLHIQEMLERGEVSGSVAKAFHIFADQIRLLNGQVSSMRREWSDESQQTKDKVNRLAAEVATQSDAGRMRMIVQRFAREVIPDSKAIVRQAIDEQAEVVEQRINLLSHEVHESVKDNEASTDRLRQMIQENREAVHRSHAASEDETLKDLPSGPLNLLKGSMRSTPVLLIECRGCKVEGDLRRSIDHQNMIPRRTGMRLLTRSIGRSRIWLEEFNVNVGIMTTSFQGLRP